MGNTEGIAICGCIEICHLKGLFQGSKDVEPGKPPNWWFVIYDSEKALQSLEFNWDFMGTYTNYYNIHIEIVLLQCFSCCETQHRQQISELRGEVEALSFELSQLKPVLALVLIVKTFVLMHLPSACCFLDPIQSMYIQNAFHLVYTSFTSDMVSAKSIAVNQNIQANGAGVREFSDRWYQ